MQSVLGIGRRIYVDSTNTATLRHGINNSVNISLTEMAFSIASVSTYFDSEKSLIIMWQLTPLDCICVFQY